MKRACGLMLLIAAALLLWTGNGEAALNIDTSYAGRYRGTPQYEKMLADLPFVYQEALQKIKRSLGIPVPDRIEVIVVFSDELTHNGLRLRGKRRSVQSAGRRILHYIYLDLEFLVTGQATLIEEMTHELTHAVMADVTGLATYEGMPMWIKEGTAVHAADQGLARIKALMRRGFSLAQFSNEDESDDGNPISLERYVENYLKVQFLLKTFGNEALHRFINRLLESGDVEAELDSCFNGLSEEVMTKYARDYITKTLVANARPRHARDQFLQGAKFFEEGEYLSARLALNDALYGGLSEDEFQKAAFLLAECYIQERNPQAAFTFLQRVRPDPKRIPVDRYRFLNAYTQYAMGQTTEAYFGFRSAFEGTSNVAVKEGALYYLIRILIDVGNMEEASRVLTHLRSAFPKSAYVPLADAVYAAAR